MPVSRIIRAAFFIIGIPCEWTELSILFDHGFCQELRSFANIFTAALNPAPAAASILPQRTKRRTGKFHRGVAGGFYATLRVFGSPTAPSPPSADHPRRQSTSSARR